MQVKELKDEKKTPITNNGKAWELVKKKYKVTEVLGNGGFGFVFAAKNRQSGEKVAIKMIKIDTERDGSYFLRKLLREIVILRKLSEMKDNVFTNKLLEIILPPDVSIESEVINQITGKIEKVERY